jgi:teichoic acid transport system ATP-binding protein
VTETLVEPPAPPAPDAPATIVVQDLHVTYRVLVGGKRYRAKNRMLRRAIPVRAIREVHAVRGVDLVIRKGEAVGLIGRNGSGKSTLLRAISGLVPPTQGAVYTLGEPTLLGVNAALMPELSGERNVILGGLALGLSLQEIEARYDEVVEFSGIGEFIELPMAAYSSGMGARLRFAIATATTQPVLLIDEALATGDADFRVRSEERIREMREHAGTLILVSHSLAAIEESCNRAIWLEQGQIVLDGDVPTVCEAYRDAMKARRRRGDQDEERAEPEGDPNPEVDG